MSSKGSSTTAPKKTITKTTTKKQTTSEPKATASTKHVEKKITEKIAEKVAPSEVPKKETRRKTTKQEAKSIETDGPSADAGSDTQSGGEPQVATAKLTNVEKHFEDILLEAKTHSKAHREYIKRLQEMRRMYLAEIKDLKKSKGKRQVSKGANRNPSGFASSSRIREPLCDFLNLEHGSKIARTIVTKKVIRYIKDNQLEEIGNRRNINPDDALERVVGAPEERLRTMQEKKKQLEEEAAKAMESTTMSDENKKKKRKKADNCVVTEKLSYFNLQVHLNKQFIKEEKKSKLIAAAEPSSEQVSVSA